MMKRGAGVVDWKKRWWWCVCVWGGEPAVEKLFHLEMKGADRERVISKGNIITFSYLLLECCGGGQGRGGEHRGAFKSNNHPWGVPAPLVHTFPCPYVAPSYCASLHAALFTHPLIFNKEKLSWKQDRSSKIQMETNEIRKPSVIRGRAKQRLGGRFGYLRQHELQGGSACRAQDAVGVFRLSTILRFNLLSRQLHRMIDRLNIVNTKFWTSVVSDSFLQISLTHQDSKIINIYSYTAYTVYFFWQ